MRKLRPMFLLWVAALAALSCADRATGVSPASAPAAAAAPARDPADPSATAPMPVDPATRVIDLPNGMRLYVRAHRKPEKRASLRLAVNVGSVLENDDERGYAHFIEHMAFNGTRLFAKQELVDYIERVGMRFGSDVNASTSFDETIYMFEVPTDDAAVMAKGLQILQQIATDVTFDPDEVNRERAVVIEEWRQGRGADARVMEQILPVLFQGSRYAERLPIGTKNTLEAATAEKLRAFYKRWYRPELMAVAVVGDFDPAVMEQQMRQTFGAIPKPPTPLTRPVHPVPEHGKALMAIGQDPELTSTTVGVLYKLPDRRDITEGDYRRRIVENLYHQMFNGRLQERARSADAPFLGAGSTTQQLVRAVDVFAQIAAVKQEGIAAGLEALTREVERVDQHGFTAGELNRSKAEALRGIQTLAVERENLPSAMYADEMIRNFLVQEAMPGVQAELRLYQRYLPTITLEEMNRVARSWITEKNRVLLVQAPKAAPVPKSDVLLAMFDRTQRERMAPYIDQAAAGPLLTTPPRPGRVVNETHLESLGVTEWKLSNGVRVVLKPTDFKQDELLMSAFSPGGHSLVPDASFVSALVAPEIVGASGVGETGPSALRNALAGKLVDVSPFIEELEEGLIGRGSPADLETMLQLVHLQITAPRRDEQVFASFQAGLAEQLVRNQVSPESTFFDKRQEILFNKHPRRRPFVPGDEKQVTLDRVMEVYRQRFARVDDMTFVFVGRIDRAKLRPLIETYLGSLPAGQGKPERWRDVGVRPVAGVKKFDVRKGVEPKSLVSITFTRKQTWTREDDHLFDSMIEALSIRLREVIREDLGGTYGVNVEGQFQRRPFEQTRVDVVFGCAPQKVDELVEAVFRELRVARTTGLAAGYVDKVKVAQRRAMERALKSNGYWLGQLVQHHRFGTDPAQILKQGALIEALTTQRMRDAAARAFDEKQYVLGVLRPSLPAVSTSGK